MPKQQTSTSRRAPRRIMNAYVLEEDMCRLEAVAKDEGRTKSRMAAILLAEALDARKVPLQQHS